MYWSNVGSGEHAYTKIWAKTVHRTTGSQISAEDAEFAESDSDLENVDITESESDEEDPLADVLELHVNIISLLYYDSTIDL